MGKVRITSTRSPRGGVDGELTLSGLSQEEIDSIKSVLNGTSWLSFKDKEAVFHDAFTPLPDPIEDDLMLPFWNSPPVEKDWFYQKTTFDFERVGAGHSPSICISNLCGYQYSAENYRRQAKILESYGFIQMRSKRGRDGMYWEIWYLPGLWSAFGDLKYFITEIKTKKKEPEIFEAAQEFIARKVQFGSMDSSVQRYFMSNED